MAKLLHGPWPVRIAWLALPFTAGPALAGALDPRSQGVRSVASIGLWIAWGAGVVAVLVPRTTTLTAIRIGAPATLVAAAWCAVATPEGAGATDVVAAAWGAVTIAAAFAPTTGDAFVNGSSYGPERRMPLRAPGAVLLGPVQLAWLAAMAGLTAGPLLLAARQWVAGGVATAVGLPAAGLAVRALHGLSRRWIVFVPAGVVLHDPLTLVDPVLLPREMLTAIGPASADDVEDAVDVTAGSPGLALEVRLDRPAQVALARRGSAEARATTHLLFTPSRPGAVLAEARARRLPVPHV